MRSGLVMTIPAAALFAVLTACGTSGNTPSVAQQAPAAAPAQQQQAPAQGGKKTEEPLSGELKQKAEAAALAQYPGTVVKSEHDAEKPGMYAVEVKQANGKSVEVYIDQSFTVSGTKDESKDAGGDTDGDG
ncbi:PepSY domain-containing protein [Amycolatopsis sp. NPDC058278]|uniref:PepSY domain-containing protein n=1 Tax=Amycolatopsis sp. NPDC058278 TaxID=3346417 RepID=UPI0036DA3011